MKITEQDLREQYESLASEELIELYAKNTLTELASSVLVQVLRKRGISPENLAELAEKEAKERETIQEDVSPSFLDLIDYIKQYDGVESRKLIELYRKGELNELAASALTQVLEKRGISLENLSKPVAKEVKAKQTYHEDRIRPLLDKDKKATVKEGGMPYKRFLQIILLIAGFAVASKLWGLQHAIGLFVFLMIHEYGHVAAMKLYGVPVHGIFVLPFIGAVAISKDEPSNLWHSFMIAYMGPVFGGIVTLIALVALFTVGEITFLRKFIILCAAVSIFNLLPLGILDGGRIVMSIAFSMHQVIGYLISIGTVLLCVAAALLMKVWFLWIVAYVAFSEMISNIRKKGLGSKLKLAKRMSVRQILSAIILYLGLVFFFIAVLLVVTKAFNEFVYYYHGTKHYDDGKYDQAISDFNKAIEIDPRYAYAYNNRGLAHWRKGQYDQAISDYNKAIEINPRYADAYYNRGLTYFNKGQYDQAISDYSKAIELDPRAALAYGNRGISYFFKKEYEKAWDDVHKAQSLGHQVHPGFLNELREASGRER